MRTPTASHRTIVAATVGLVLSLSLVACSRGVAESPGFVGCSLEQFHGNLVAESGRPVFRSIQHNLPSDPVPLDWPDGWTIRPTDDGQVEVLDRNGALRVWTGMRVVLLTDGDNDTPALNRDGKFVVCEADPFWEPDGGGDAP